MRHGDERTEVRIEVVDPAEEVLSDLPRAYCTPRQRIAEGQGGQLMQFTHRETLPVLRGVAAWIRRLPLKPLVHYGRRFRCGARRPFPL